MRWETLSVHSPYGKPTAGNGQAPCTGAMPLRRSSSHTDKEGFQHEGFRRVRDYTADGHVN